MIEVRYRMQVNIDGKGIDTALFRDETNRCLQSNPAMERFVFFFFFFIHDKNLYIG
jgi:hypothetical protein